MVDDALREFVVTESTAVDDTDEQCLFAFRLYDRLSTWDVRERCRLAGLTSHLYGAEPWHRTESLRTRLASVTSSLVADLAYAFVTLSLDHVAAGEFRDARTGVPIQVTMSHLNDDELAGLVPVYYAWALEKGWAPFLLYDEDLDSRVPAPEMRRVHRLPALNESYGEPLARLARTNDLPEMTQRQ